MAIDIQRWKNIKGWREILFSVVSFDDGQFQQYVAELENHKLAAEIGFAHIMRNKPHAVLFLLENSDNFINGGNLAVDLPKQKTAMKRRTVLTLALDTITEYGANGDVRELAPNEQRKVSKIGREMLGFKPYIWHIADDYRYAWINETTGKMVVYGTENQNG